jgi:RimJ/RimL family protein N-acetyltransferase
MINRTAEFAIYIGDKDFRGKGYSKEATIQTLKFGFYKLGLNRIFLKVLEENEPAIHLYKSIGFVNEGLLRSSVYKNGKFKNECIFSLLSAEMEFGK